MRTRQIDSTEIYTVKSRPVLEGIAIGALILLSIAASAAFLYYQAVNAVKAEIKEGIVRSTGALAAVLDGDTHEKFTSKAQKYDPEYLEYVAPLERARQASKYVPYIYTNIMIDDKVYFIVNPSPQLDLDQDGFPDDSPDLMDLYDAPSSSLLDALVNEKVVVDEEPYTDQWGTFISAYAPIYNSSGNFVGTLGMDLNFSGFEERLLPTKNAFKTAAITGVVMAILVGVTVWYNRRIIRLMSRSRNSAIERFMEANEYVRLSNRNKAALMDYLIRSMDGFKGEERDKALENLKLLAKLQDDECEFDKSNIDVIGLTSQVCDQRELKLQVDKDIPRLVYASDFLLQTIFDYISAVSRELSLSSIRLKVADETAHAITITTELVAKESVDEVALKRFIKSLTFLENIDDSQPLNSASELSPSIFYNSLTLLHADIDMQKNGDKVFGFSIKFEKFLEDEDADEPKGIENNINTPAGDSNSHDGESSNSKVA